MVYNSHMSASLETKPAYLSQVNGTPLSLECPVSQITNLQEFTTLAGWVYDWMVDSATTQRIIEILEEMNTRVHPELNRRFQLDHDSDTIDYLINRTNHGAEKMLDGVFTWFDSNPNQNVTDPELINCLTRFVNLKALDACLAAYHNDNEPPDDLVEEVVGQLAQIGLCYSPDRWRERCSGHIPPAGYVAGPYFETPETYEAFLSTIPEHLEIDLSPQWPTDPVANLLFWTAQNGRPN
jgi:hypothetical protein